MCNDQFTRLTPFIQLETAKLRLAHQMNADWPLRGRGSPEFTLRHRVETQLRPCSVVYAVPGTAPSGIILGPDALRSAGSLLGRDRPSRDGSECGACCAERCHRPSGTSGGWSRTVRGPTASPLAPDDEWPQQGCRPGWRATGGTGWTTTLSNALTAGGNTDYYSCFPPDVDPDEAILSGWWPEIR